MSNSEFKTEPPLPAHHPPAANSPGWTGRPVFICLALAAVTFAIFGRVLGYEYINYDDPEFVTSNPHVLRGLTWEGVRWAFQPGHVDYWHPLTWLSLMLDVTLFGTAARGLHFTNVLLHAANGIGVFLLFRRITGAHWRSALVAALFALHPLRVESVAWITERKDVLSTFFGLLALLFYVRFAQRQARGPWSVVPYLASLVCFALGLMSKAMLVTLPLVMLLLDYWPLGRVRSAGCGVRSAATRNPEPSRIHSALRIPHSALFWEKLPFFVLSAISAVVTYGTERAANRQSSFPLGMRLENALVAYGRYLGKTIWPVDLAVSYPHPGQWRGWELALALAVVVGVSVMGLWWARRRPYVLVGWCWFLGTLVPVIGLTKGWQQFMADRFTYVPHIGLFLAVVWGAGELCAAWRCSRRMMLAVAGLLLLAGSLRTWDQLSHWRDSGTLFRHALSVKTGNAVAHVCLGQFLTQEGRGDEAMEHWREAIRADPTYVKAFVNLGAALAIRNQYLDAIDWLEMALERQPDNVDALNNLGGVLAETGRLEDAVARFQEVLRLDPQNGDAHFNLAGVLAARGDRDGAIRHYREALRLRPGDAQAQEQLRRLVVTVPQ